MSLTAQLPVDAGTGSLVGAAATNPADRLKIWVVGEWQRMRLFYGIFSAWVGLTVAATYYYGDDLFPSLLPHLVRMRLIILFLLPLLAIGFVIARLVRRDPTFGHTLRWFRTHVINTDTVTRFGIAAASFPLFMACFLYWKMKIPLFQPFIWDRTFAQWDAVLLGGYQAWELVFPYLSSDGAIRFVDIVYAGWGPLCAGFWLVIFASNGIDRATRDQYLLSTLVAWLLIGLVSATVLSSAGPAFYEKLTGDGALYGALVAHLHAFNGPEPLPEGTLPNLSAPFFQNMLWDLYQQKYPGVGGISAMPSMHNAQALLFLLVALRLSRPIAWAMGVFVVIIFVGSVLLAWHYMIDGLVAFALAGAVWIGCGAILRRNHARGGGASAP